MNLYPLKSPHYNGLDSFKSVSKRLCFLLCYYVDNYDFIREFMSGQTSYRTSVGVNTIMKQFYMDMRRTDYTTPSYYPESTV
jgi:hypothetical protein